MRATRLGLDEGCAHGFVRVWKQLGERFAGIGENGLSALGCGERDPLKFCDWIGGASSGWVKAIVSLGRSEVAVDLFGLYVIQAVQVALPLLMIPYLARCLGPCGWGTVAYFQSFALYMGTLLEFGFNLSATRSVARNRESLEFRSKALAEVMAAKALLLLAIAVPLLAAFLLFGKLHEHPVHFWSAILWGSAQGLNLVWYFQGLGQMRKLAIVEVSARLAAAGLIIATVHSPGSTWLVLFLNGAGAAAATTISSVIAYREIAFVRPTWSAGVRGLRTGFTMFLFRSAVSLYTLGNSFILGCFVSPVIVGYYAGAERISKGLLSIVQPLNQTMYARINYSIATNRDVAARLARRGILAMTGLGLLLGGAVYCAAPLLVRLMLGDKFLPAIPAVRIMAFLPPLICLATSIGANWMLPLNLDRQFTSIILAAGLINVSLASLLAPTLQHIGMSIAVVVSEGFVASAFIAYLWISRLDPFRSELRRPAVAAVLPIQQDG